MFSSTSDDSDDDSTAIFEGRLKRKRRRKSRRKLELFLENLVREVMEKQEQMHKQLIEMIEKKEKERITREEAWKQQEMERMKRDEEARAQETSRNLALISFIQNILGHEIQIPQVQPVVYRSMEESGAETNSQKDVKCDSNTKRWPEDEVQALITLRTSLEHKFRITGSKGSIWEEISVGMCNMGYNRTAKKCKEKWENINKYFRRSMMGSGKNRSANSKTRPYFHDLDLLYKNSLVNPENGFPITKEENEA